ncbi:hypothetical protein CONCODRAFT_5537 [Conidiobolus coronatus NRRL 28638]|uniref:Uncharacterized protein n=1 Tax=Conidiobolus coronatus (strain ATCC 28846 / CBS 209.66 / NRRL 28638) TaxID=796925 RepID=A0A137P9R6_CONC2|nr:hypothetical protein CONCODRAFT_5537 [Conidiobolus coronatus NRRL 28638]|eukprot:KXN71740.1 hypothetical protein CONCODRAFT_5537 [Conidiobolus coronatus NRRL 28638]
MKFNAKFITIVTALSYVLCSPNINQYYGCNSPVLHRAPHHESKFHEKLMLLEEEEERERMRFGNNRGFEEFLKIDEKKIIKEEEIGNFGGTSPFNSFGHFFH